MSDSNGFLLASTNQENATLITRDGNAFNQADLSFITRLAAIGDSYSAGIGAGEKLGSVFGFWDPDSDYSCSRCDHSYPFLVNNDERLGASSNRKFQFKSCSGAVISDVLERQIPAIDSNQQVILISAGGNDVELTNTLNQCIFQWAVLSTSQVIEAMIIVAEDDRFSFLDFLDMDVYGRGCEGQMDVSQALIDGPAFSSSLDSLISAAKAKLGPGGKIYYTGYAKFWAADLTSACDTVTWGTWLHKAANVWEPYQRLTVSHRKRMNALVDAVNDKLSAAVARAGPSVVFIDYDSYLTNSKGHFCEAGVDETPTNGISWNDDLFFKMDSGAQASSPWKRDSVAGVKTGSFKGSLEVMTQLTLMLDPTSQLLVEDVIEESKVASVMDEGEDPSDPGELLKDYYPNFLPDGFGRVFHPQEILHEIIAELIISEMGVSKLLDEGFPAITDDADLGSGGSCPYSPSGGQQIAIASYTNPLGDPNAWQRLISYDSNKHSILIANVLNGPDYVVDTSWKSVIEQAANSGKTVIGYVRTGYLGVSQQQFKTRLGSGNLADWTSQIEQDVDKWFELYPDTIGGIFFDEGWPECGPNNIYSDLYTHINAYTKRKHPGAYTVLNPGSPMAQCFENTMDTLLTFESSYETYTSSAYTPNDWKPQDSRKIWHIVYRVPQDKIAEVAALALERGAGYLEMTSDDNPNPYDNVPSDEYMNEAMKVVSGGTVRKDSAPSLGGSYVSGVPNDAQVIASDYTSATITWSPVAKALGYAVYQNGALVIEMPAFLTRATIGMLEPGTTGISFEVKTILTSGSGGTSKLLTMSTKALPDGKSISNVQYVKIGDQVVYTADVLVPYAFVRLFIGGPHQAIGASAGWPIDAGLSTDNGGGDPIGQYKLVNYLVEGNDFYPGFYKYTGAYVEGGSGNADWTWLPQGTAPQTQSGYTNTWYVPLGGTDALPDNFVVQGQGYAPLQNIFHGPLRSYKCDGQPCDDNSDYDCKGSSLCSLPTLLAWCDRAVNNLNRTDILTYGTSGDAENGGCASDGNGGCGVFLQGYNCAMSGNDMWKTYQNLRKLGGCSKCGSFHQEDGCMLTVNYVAKC